MDIFLKVLGCAGCVIGAVGLVAAGPAALLAAAATPGSTLAVAGCVGVCVSLF